MQLKLKCTQKGTSQTLFNVVNTDRHFALPYLRDEEAYNEFEVGKHYIMCIEPETFDPPPFRGEQPLAHHLVM